MKRRMLVALSLMLMALLLTASVATAQDNHARASLEPVDDSGVSGSVSLQAQNGGGTRINVVAFGLNPGEDYVSIYYENDTCELEEESAEEIVGDSAYTANAAGVGHTRGEADEDLDEIGSVSVRSADLSVLFACADIDPDSTYTETEQAGS